MADVVPAPPGAFPTTYRERLAQFKILEERRFELIEVNPLSFSCLESVGC